MEVDPIAAAYGAYLQALIGGRESEAVGVVDRALVEGIRPEELYIRVFQPALRQIGSLWQHNQFHVAEEHRATAITRRLMARFTTYFRSPTRQLGRTILLACVAGEIHEVGLQMVSDIYERDGWDVVYLGANVPTHDLIELVVQVDPDVIGLSATLAYHLPTVQDVVTGLRIAGCRAKIAVGGFAFTSAPDVAERMGVELWTNDALQSVEQTNALFDLHPQESPEPLEVVSRWTA